MDYTEPAYEPRLDGSYGNVEFAGSGFLRREGMYTLFVPTASLRIPLTACFQVPERLRPYKYDIWGSSHQILHVAVILAGLAHMFGLFRAFQHLHTRGSRCS